VKLKLAELDPAVETVVAMNLDELDKLVASHADSLDLALVDITMPGTQGHQHVSRLRAQAPALPVIVLSGSEDVDLMRSLMEIGVLGFIPKPVSVDALLTVLARHGSHDGEPADVPAEPEAGPARRTP